eukprot:1160901-Pelagomonas_calceolata.AAC.10
MQKDPSARPPASELLQHPFVAECGDAVPEGLVEMVHEFSKRRRPVTSRSAMQLRECVCACVLEASHQPSNVHAPCSWSLWVSYPAELSVYHEDGTQETSQDLPAGTLPGWDFGTKKFGRSTQKMGDTLKAAVVDR